MAKEVCSICGKEEPGVFSTEILAFHELDGKQICDNCLKEKQEAEKRKFEESIVLTTTNSIDGHKVVKYIGIATKEIVLGTGAFSEFSASFADLFGKRATEFEKKLEKGKEFVLTKLRYQAYEEGGNAVLGIDIDYTEFESNVIGIVATGTVVIIEPV